MKKSVFLFTLATAGLSATAAMADAEHPLADLMKNTGLEFTGYARMGTAWNANGSNNMVNYNLPGAFTPHATGRLGNEVSNNYMEFGLGGVGYKGTDGSEFDFHFMEAINNESDNGFSSQTNSFSLANEQLWAEAKGLVKGNTISFWAGKRFYRPDGPPGNDINIFDYRPFGHIETGAGFDRLAVGNGDLWFDVSTNGQQGTTDSTAQPVQGSNTSAKLSWYSINVNPGGKLFATVQVDFGGANNGFGNSDGGWAGYLWHAQKLGGLDNSFGIAYGEGSAAMGGLSGVGGTNSSTKPSHFRVYDQIVGDIDPMWSGQLAALYEEQDNKGSAPGHRTDQWAIAGQAQLHMTQHVSLLLEPGYSQVKPSNMSTESMSKVTGAVALRPGRGYWDRPELRFFVTFASWNDAARKAGMVVNDKNGKPSMDTDGTTFGVQSEFWW